MEAKRNLVIAEFERTYIPGHNPMSDPRFFGSPVTYTSTSEMADEIVRLRNKIQRIKREMYQEALDDMRQLAAPLFAELEKRKEGAA